MLLKNLLKFTIIMPASTIRAKKLSKEYEIKFSSVMNPGGLVARSFVFFPKKAFFVSSGKARGGNLFQFML